MPAQRLPMRQVREVLRLKHAAGASERHIAASLGISRSTVAEYLRRAAVVGITWPVPDELGDIALERRLFSPPFAVHESPRPQPDWARLQSSSPHSAHRTTPTPRRGGRRAGRTGSAATSTR